MTSSSYAPPCRGQMSDEIRVALVDDDALVRSGLIAMLDGAEGIRVVSEASDGREVPDLVSAHRPHVVLMDLRMQQIDGISATRKLTATASPPSVIVLTTFEDDDLILQALHAGAVGYLLKHTAPADIVRAIRLVHGGASMLSPEVTRRLIRTVASQADVSGRRARARELLGRLTPREREVAHGVATGSSNGEIAEALSLSVATIKGHITMLLIKLEVENRVQLALMVQAAG